MGSSRDHTATDAATRSALPPTVPQPLDCEVCGDDGCGPDDFIQGLGAVICPICLESLMDTPEERL